MTHTYFTTLAEAEAFVLAQRAKGKRGFVLTYMSTRHEARVW